MLLSGLRLQAATDFLALAAKRETLQDKPVYKELSKRLEAELEKRLGRTNLSKRLRAILIGKAFTWAADALE